LVVLPEGVAEVVVNVKRKKLMRKRGENRK
jgi:hypothetical protein